MQRFLYIVSVLWVFSANAQTQMVQDQEVAAGYSKFEKTLESSILSGDASAASGQIEIWETQLKPWFTKLDSTLGQLVEDSSSKSKEYDKKASEPNRSSNSAQGYRSLAVKAQGNASRTEKSRAAIKALIKAGDSLVERAMRSADVKILVDSWRATYRAKLLLEDASKKLPKF